MAEKYFEKFPIITYNGAPVRNITERAAVINSVYNNPIFYYPYDVQQNEHPDEIADRYYQDEYMGWILHITNKVIDPYYDWYIDQTSFEDYITNKYGSLSNATSKIKYFRNNWYSNESTISETIFQNLYPTLKRFYEPVYGDILYSTTPLGYKRKQIDWKISTNYIVQYNGNGSNFITDEVVDIYSNDLLVGSGQVCGKTSSTLLIQHTSGNVTIASNAPYIIGRESLAKIFYTTSTVVANNIPTFETQYWSPVYYYDYESEINEKNKSIQVLKKQYSSQISGELRNLLK